MYIVSQRTFRLSQYRFAICKTLYFTHNKKTHKKSESRIGINLMDNKSSI
jgi:hypothetical protein